MADPASAVLCGWLGDAVHVDEPQTLRSAAVFSTPHSGRRYPQGFQERSRLDPLALRASEDAYVDRLFETAPQHGAPLISALFPRAFLDVNRAADELDPALIHRCPKRRASTLRVAAGLGVVPRIVAEGVPIYDGKLSLPEAQARIECCHRPYHAALERTLARAGRFYGQALLIDCHSMPSESERGRKRRSEIVIGDCYGAAASSEITDAVIGLFREAGFNVARNTPFAGGYITQRYGRPNFGHHAIQIEIDRSLYLDQSRMEPSSDFAAMQAKLRPIIARLCELPLSLSSALAAQ